MSSVHEIRSDRAATDPAGPTGRLAAWLASLRLEDVPERVRQRATHLLLDGISCALVGARLPWSRRAVESLCRLEGSGPAQMIGWNRGVPPPLAALLNSTFIQGFELDDFHPFAPLYSASLVPPALLACAQANGKRGGRVTGADFLKGAIAGFEVRPRVGLGLHGIEMLSRGWHSGAVFGTHAAAAAAGTLLRLDPAGFEDALGMSGT
ncbi:MmgE/PrpD family protein [Azospirillum sp. A26]|uniref:MmgE/PrpD family protein n=1 Tax=Azospirillum sp. A26 TaxID=3160607 RepID=UPI0036704B0D